MSGPAHPAPVGVTGTRACEFPATFIGAHGVPRISHVATFPQEASKRARPARDSNSPPARSAPSCRAVLSLAAAALRLAAAAAALTTGAAPLLRASVW